MPRIDTSEYNSEFSERGFWSKLKKYAKNIGKDAVEHILILYYSIHDEAVPAKAKAIIIGALGYFISPIDIIPDIVPVFGYTDDISVLSAAVAAIALYVSKETKEKAGEKVRDWFE
jgi:uncharacterized membrane protein YkvA (DUF1232 family)